MNWNSLPDLLEISKDHKGCILHSNFSLHALAWQVAAVLLYTMQPKRIFQGFSGHSSGSKLLSHAVLLFVSGGWKPDFKAKAEATFSDVFQIGAFSEMSKKILGRRSIFKGIRPKRAYEGGREYYAQTQQEVKCANEYVLKPDITVVCTVLTDFW